MSQIFVYVLIKGVVYKKPDKYRGFWNGYCRESLTILLMALIYKMPKMYGVCGMGNVESASKLPVHI
jgi:hypothetical protein